MSDDLKYDVNRSELISSVPSSARSVLDIGCAGGRYGAELKASRPDIEVWGVEPDPANARMASERLDHVVEGGFPDVIEKLPAGFFDVITFNDVLEHVVEPAEAITATRSLLSPTGVIVASIPNVRHREVTWPLLRRGRWDYEEYGLLDRTHLRFFTRQTMLELFTKANWKVDSCVGINRSWNLADDRERRKLRWIRKVAGSRLDEFFYVQYLITARPPT